MSQSIPVELVPLGMHIEVACGVLLADVLAEYGGEVLAVRTALNPQCAHGANVMGRVQYALPDSRPTQLIRKTIGGIVAELAGERAPEVRQKCVVFLILQQRFGATSPLSSALDSVESRQKGTRRHRTPISEVGRNVSWVS